uniref:NADH dehydrogenase [ubiquinone] 1 alpha subcomplex subunit 2 n=1 Tax=Acrobeloides nanus TaxID=290746 RepID=A0A914E2G2_9BILA
MASAIRLGTGALRELRIHLCLKSPASNGVRAFIENDYVPLKKNNLNFPILIREASGISPRIWARYEYGVETNVSLEDAPREKVLEIVRSLAAQSPPKS